MPTWADIEVLAEAMETQLPGRGAALVKVAAGSGLRIGELAGLQVKDVHLDTMTIDVHRQLSRYRPWPATDLPKGGKKRTTIFWAFLRPELEHLVEHSVDGWLIPRSQPPDTRCHRRTDHQDSQRLSPCQLPPSTSGID